MLRSRPEAQDSEVDLNIKVMREEVEEMRAIFFAGIVVLVQAALLAKSFGVQADPPSISPAPGIYPTPIEVVLSSPLRNATFKYRTDGITPGTRFPGIDYGGPISLGPGEYDIAAVTNAPFYDTSVGARADYVVGNPSLPNLQLLIEYFFDVDARIHLTSTVNGAEIYYSFGEEMLSSNSTEYEGDLPLAPGDYTLRAFSHHDGEVSVVQTWNFTVSEPQLSFPEISPDGATSTESITVSMTPPVAGAEIRYTTNGAHPTIFSPLYEGPFVISNLGAPKTVEVRAIAIKEGYRASSPRLATYVIEQLPQMSPPKILPEEGAYQLPLTVFLSHSDENATIRYTTDGSNPVDSSPVYPPGGIVISDPGDGPVVTVKAAAIGPGFRLGEVVEASYVVGAASFSSYLDLYLPEDRYPASVRSWTSDPDRDGFETGLEYASGTDPADQTSIPFFRARNEGDHLIVEYRNAQQATDLVWAYDWSRDGESWNPLGSDPDIAMTDSVASTEASGTIENRELRLIPVTEQKKVLVRLKVRRAP